VDTTKSYLDVFPEEVLNRFDFAETRNAARILQATNPVEFAEINAVLTSFSLEGTDLTVPGGNKSDVAARLDHAFRQVGWRESRCDLEVGLHLRITPYRRAGETHTTERTETVRSEGYKVDNFKGRVALDVEWNAKDGNLDRDLAAYRVMYEAGLIDAAVIITRSQEDLRVLARSMGVKKLDTTTTTNLPKLLPRLQRGDSGGCPVLAVAITARCMIEVAEN